MQYDWNFTRLLPYWRAFLEGVLTTLSLAVVTIILGTALGLFAGWFLRKRRVGLLLYLVVDITRALPPLVLILFMYYFLTRQVIGFTVPAFWVCVVAMSLNLAAYASDLIRSAFDSVSPGDIDAGRALGMSPKQIRIHIVLPHIFRQLIPGMVVLYLGILKMTSLASLINVRDTVFAAQTVIAEISRSLEAWTVVAAIYVVLVVPSTYAARYIERWANRGRQPQASRSSIV